MNYEDEDWWKEEEDSEFDDFLEEEVNAGRAETTSVDADGNFRYGLTDTGMLLNVLQDVGRHAFRNHEDLLETFEDIVQSLLERT